MVATSPVIPLALSKEYNNSQNRSASGTVSGRVVRKVTGSTTTPPSEKIMDTRVAGVPRDLRNLHLRKHNKSTPSTASRSYFLELPKELQHDIISSFCEEIRDPRDPTLISFTTDIKTLVALRLCVASAYFRFRPSYPNRPQSMQTTVQYIHRLLIPVIYV